jgi:hypothetical protein
MASCSLLPHASTSCQGTCKPLHMQPCPEHTPVRAALHRTIALASAGQLVLSWVTATHAGAHAAPGQQQGWPAPGSAPSLASRSSALRVLESVSAPSSTTSGISGTCSIRWPRASTSEGSADAASAETTAYLQQGCEISQHQACCALCRFNERNILIQIS